MQSAYKESTQKAHVLMAMGFLNSCPILKKSCIQLFYRRQKLMMIYLWVINNYEF